MGMNSLKQIQALGQSLWMDYIRRDLMTSGELGRMIETDGLRGMTSNPAIFAQAIQGSDLYDQDLQALAAEGRSPREIYEALSQGDVRSAADAFRPLYDQTDGQDGFVSLEVNPHLARDTQGTLEEARRLWAAVGRPNLMIKVPGTQEGLPAIQQLLREGINVNVTLLFGVPRYREVAAAYLAGLEGRLADGKPIHRVASVASFFVSRIDTLVDPLLTRLAGEGGKVAGAAKGLIGQVAIANSKLAYQTCKELYAEPGPKALLAAGGHVQRLLWASTGTKDPAYSDIKYVEALLGPLTVDTLPMATLEAYRDHGNPRVRLEQDLPAMRWVMAQLPELDLDLDVITARLEAEGVAKFEEPFDHLMETLALRAAAHETSL